jgi:hypothetical protein
MYILIAMLRVANHNVPVAGTRRGADLGDGMMPLTRGHGYIIWNRH